MGVRRSPPHDPQDGRIYDCLPFGAGGGKSRKYCWPLPTSFLPNMRKTGSSSARWNGCGRKQISMTPLSMKENCTNIRATAKELQIGERAFCRFLMDAGFLYRCPAGYLLPYAKPSNDGLFRVKDFWKYGHFGQQTLITPQGKNVIRLLLDDGQMRLEWKERMG